MGVYELLVLPLWNNVVSLKVVENLTYMKVDFVLWREREEVIAKKMSSAIPSNVRT